MVAQAGLDSIELTELKTLAGKKKSASVVLAMHDQLLAELTAADPRVGKAYGLGRGSPTAATNGTISTASRRS